MTAGTARLADVTLKSPALVQGRRPPPQGVFRRTTAVAGDGLGAVALVLCIPFVILAVGIPIALGVRLLLWIAEAVL